MGLKDILYRWGPVIGWMGFIYFLSNQPGLKIAEGTLDYWTRKPAHIFIYLVLYLLIRRAFEGKRIFESLLLTFLYGISDEVHQHFVVNRTGKAIDLIFDLAGGILGIIIWNIYQTLLKKPKSSPQN